jgi:hypothetical protein
VRLAGHCNFGPNARFRRRGPGSDWVLIPPISFSQRHVPLTVHLRAAGSALVYIPPLRPVLPLSSPPKASMHPFFYIAATSLVNSLSPISIHPRSHPISHSPPTMPSIGASQQLPSQSWPPYSLFRPFGPSFFSLALALHFQPSSSRSPHTFSSSLCP